MAALGTRSLTLSIGGTEYSAMISATTIESAAADSDFTSWADAAAGGARDYVLKFTMVQDPTPGSLWDKVWTATGSTVAAIVRPAGGTTASATQPTFTGNVVITEPDGVLIGGEANSSPSARLTTEVEWKFTAKPLRAVA